MQPPLRSYQMKYTPKVRQYDILKLTLGVHFVIDGLFFLLQPCSCGARITMLGKKAPEFRRRGYAHQRGAERNNAMAVSHGIISCSRSNLGGVSEGRVLAK